MTFRIRISIFPALCLLLQTIPVAHAEQLCFDRISTLSFKTVVCADVSYSADGWIGSQGPEDFYSVLGSNFGLASGNFDGFKLWSQDTAETSAPDNVQSPFGASADIQVSNDNRAFSIQHRGAVTMGPRDSLFQSIDHGGLSRVTFITLAGGSTGPVTLEPEFAFEFILRDPSGNATTGDVQAAARMSIFGENSQVPLFEFSGICALDLAIAPDPQCFGDFNGAAVSFEPSGPGIGDEFDVAVNFHATFQANPGEELQLETDTFGSIFTDGFESGDTSAWSSSSPDTFNASVSSSNPNVQFKIVTEPNINAGMNDAWVSADAPFQGFFFTVFPDTGFFFMSLFTFDSVIPAGPDTAVFGAFDQRWVTGGGFYLDNKVTINVELTSGGIFNGSVPEASQTPGYGTITIEFINCNEAILTYDFPSLVLSGQMTLTRVLPDNVALCQQLAGQ